MRHFIVAFLVVATALVHPIAQERSRIDVSKLGPQVGERVPDFNLLDQSGKTRNLRSIVGTRGAMLVFIRSADW
jgi:peroxiredoxin